MAPLCQAELFVILASEVFQNFFVSCLLFTYLLLKFCDERLATEVVAL